MNPIRVMIADDHELVRVALKTLIEAEDDLEVVAEASDTEDAIECALASRPDVLLLDLRMPGKGGAEVCRRVREDSPETRVLVVTSFDGDDELFGVLDAGANGYLMKDTKPERVAPAVRAVYDGQAVFDAAIASRVINGRSNETDANALLADPLSERELEVLQHMGQGLGNKDIGRRLWISETTVKTHVSHVLRKLGQSDRTQAVITALRLGIIRLDEQT